MSEPVRRKEVPRRLLKPARSLRIGTMLLGLSVLGMAASGCEVLGYMLGAGGEHVPAEYELADRPTLVMVDDPQEALGDPALVGVLARSVENHIEGEGLLSEAGLIPQAERRAVADELGDGYDRAPIDRVGRLAGAEQVIHVTVRSVQMIRAVNVYEPTVELEVKVIDAENSRRLFPEAGRFDTGDEPAPGHRLTTRLDASTMDSASQGAEAMLARRLAEHAGQDVGRLFHDWRRQGGPEGRPR